MSFDNEIENTEPAVETDLDLDLDDKGMQKVKAEFVVEEETKPEMITTRNFRSVPDIENFYRFVNDYNLRHEAKVLLNIVTDRVFKTKKRSKKNIH